MAKIYLEADDSVFTVVNDGSTIYGTADTDENVVLNTGADGITVDSTIERVDFAGDIGDFLFAQGFGSNIEIQDSLGNVIATIADVEGKEMAFGDGTVVLAYTDGTVSVGGTDITTTAAAVVPVTIDDTDTSASDGDGTTPVEGQTFTLTTSADISGTLVGSAGTTSTDGDDTFTATSGTLDGTDVLLGGNGTDTLNVAVTAATTAPSSVVGIEDVNFNVTSFADIALDADNILGTGTTITVNNLQAGGTTNANIDNVETGATVVAGTMVTGTLDVEADGYVTIDGGSATTLTLAFNDVTTQSTVTANSATTITASGVDDVSISSTSATSVSVTSTGTDSDDSATISAKNASSTSVVALETLAAGAQVEYLSLSGNGGAVTFDLDATGDDPTNYTFTGDQNVTLVGTSAQFTGDTATDSTTDGTTTLKIDTASAATADLGKVAVDVIELAHTDAQAIAYDLKNDAGVKLSAAAGAAVTLASDELTTGDETVNLTAKVTQTSATNVDDFETVNLTVDDGAATTGTVTLNDLNASNATAGKVVVTGADNLILTGADTAFLDASAFTGALTATLASDLLKVTGGSGNDTIIGSALAFTVDGGGGTDTITFEGVTTTDLTAVAETLSNVEILALDTANAGIHNLTVDTAFISGKSYVVTGVGTNDVLTVVTSGTGTLDLSGLTVDDADIAVTITTTATNGVANNITGSNADDTTAAATAAGVFTIDSKAGDDVIVTGLAADNITLGEGTDSVDANAGADTIDLTEITAAVDTVILAANDSTEAAMDKISGFTTHATTGDLLDINTTTLAASIGATDVSGVTSETGDTVTATTSATGIMTLAGANASNIDTLAEWIDAAEVLLTTLVSVNSTADVLGVLAFEYSGNTYVVEGSDTGADAYTTSVVVELTGVTGITGLSTTAAANVIDIV